MEMSTDRKPAPAQWRHHAGARRVRGVRAWSFPRNLSWRKHRPGSNFRTPSAAGGTGADAFRPEAPRICGVGGAAVVVVVAAAVVVVAACYVIMQMNPWIQDKFNVMGLTVVAVVAAVVVAVAIATSRCSFSAGLPRWRFRRVHPNRK